MIYQIVIKYDGDTGDLSVSTNSGSELIVFYGMMAAAEQRLMDHVDKLNAVKEPDVKKVAKRKRKTANKPGVY